MKKKELKALAKKIAELEIQLSLCHDLQEKGALEQKIMMLCGKVSSIEDMDKLDDLIQEELKK